jgi:trk system potassium uptake protein TrkA
VADRKRSVAVIGLGAFGSAVATELARLDTYVLGIDIEERRVAAMAEVLAEAKILDAADEAALREAGIDRFGSVVIGIGENVEASILATMNARLLGCENLWAKAKDRTHYRILVKIGADRVILPEADFARRVAQVLNNPAVRDFISVGNGYHVVNVEIPERLAGKMLGSLKLADRLDLRALGLMRGTEFHATDRDDLVFEEGDKLLILGKRTDLVRFGDTL